MKYYKIERCKNDEHEFIQKFVMNLRESDRMELDAVSNKMYGQEISDSIKNSAEAYKVTGEKGEPLVLYGAVKMKNRSGALIWCLATDDIMHYKRELVKVSAAILKIWVKRYGRLYNCVAEFNARAIRWLEHNGAKFEPSMPLGKHHEGFLYFQIGDEKKCAQ